MFAGLKIRASIPRKGVENLELCLRWVSEDLERRAEQHLMSGRYKEAKHI